MALSDITNMGGTGYGKLSMEPWKAVPAAAPPSGGGGSLLKPSAQSFMLRESRGQATCSTSRSTSSTTYGTGASASMDVDEDVRFEDEDPQMVAEYAADIYRNLGRGEANFLPRPDYMDGQADVNHKMRAILVDWLVEVHMKYKLKTETLFLTVNLIDRFLEAQQLPRKRLQLCGVTATLIASKFEEIYPPEVRDFVYITDKAYTKEDILNMEVTMLNKLQFILCAPTAAHFFERYSRVNSCTDQHRFLMQYMLELTLQEHKMIKYSPSHLTAAAAYLSNKLLKQQPSWPPAMIRATQQTESMIKECAREMCSIFEAAREERGQLQAVRRKFSHRKFGEVAKRFL